MDNPTRWNITNSAQNIVSALVDPSKQFDHVFRREWSNTFSGFTRHKPNFSVKSKQDADLKSKLSQYIKKLEERKTIKSIEEKHQARSSPSQNSPQLQLQSKIIVPEVFLREDFDLSNLEVFNKVISMTSKLQTSVSTKTENGLNKLIESNDDDLDLEQYMSNRRIGVISDKLVTKSQLKELQQNLTDYLDIIEEKLASQISNRSGDFFQVMSSVDSVMDELSLAIKSVTNLRKKCSSLNENLILPNMKSIHLSKNRDNAQLVLDKMKEISELCKVQPMVQLLLSTSDFNGALDLIAKTRVKLHQDLTQVVCLKHLESQLVEIERVIGAMMQQEFIENQRFVNKFHDERKKKIESYLDIEQWKMVEDIPPDFQLLLTKLLDEGVSISETFSSNTKSTSNQCNSGQNSSHHSRNSSDFTSSAIEITTNNTSTHNQQQQQSDVSYPITKQINSKLTETNMKRKFISGKSSQVSACGSTYVIVNSVINLVRIVMDYCKCANDIRTLSADLLERLFEILKLYNSKTYHLVYSAGAIQVAGLKTITTRSLVVSQRSLKLIILMIPAIYKHFSQLLPHDKTLTIRLRHFDDIKSSYIDHAAKIPERVNSIVRDVINLQLQEWEAKPPVPSSQFNAIAQHLMRLHDNIQDALPLDELRLLFVNINQTFKDLLIRHLRRLNISNDAGPQQWLVTQELTFYKISLSKLSVFNGWELDYDDLWTKLNSESSDSNNSSRRSSVND